MCREFICKLLGCKEIQEQETNIPEPFYLENIDYNEVSTILKAEFPIARLYLSDNKYKTTTIDELRNYLRFDLTDKNRYVPEYYDCDDFSYALMGSLSNPSWGCLPFGILWTSTSNSNHAVNCFIDNNRKVWIIEPQTDAVFELPEYWTPYLVMM